MLGPAAFWLLDPIVHLAGVPFLLFFSTLVITALVAVWVLLERTRRSDLPNLRIPDQLDPYQIAYLRGGDSEVIRTAMVEMVEHGWIVQDPTQKVSATKPIQWKTDLQGKLKESFEPLQRILLENFQVSRTGDSVFQSSVQKKVQVITETCRKWVVDEE
ncbi:MAG: TIGR04222 domain-containing membrane protein, partial [Pirellula sp.]